MPSPIIDELTFRDAADGTVKTGKIKDTTYGVVEKGSAGLCPALPDEDTTTKFLRQDGNWEEPPQPPIITTAELSAICV